MKTIEIILHNLRIILDVGLVALFAFIAFRFYKHYQECEGDTWYKRAWCALSASATNIWNVAVAAASAVTLFAQQIAEFLNAPEVATVIGTYNPETIARVGLVIAGIGIVARLRTLFASKE